MNGPLTFGGPDPNIFGSGDQPDRIWISVVNAFIRFHRSHNGEHDVCHNDDRNEDCQNASHAADQAGKQYSNLKVERLFALIRHEWRLVLLNEPDDERTDK